jgi:DNA-binding NarL/FixJ family response regulator
MQEELLKAHKLESLEILAGGIAHDFNNILTGILGNLSLANTRLDPSHAVILDLTIPGGMGGKEAAGLLLEINPDVLLIVSSGYSNDPVVADYRSYGFSGAVSNPFDVKGMLAELGRLMRQGQ